ncbi:MAG TPA: HAD-IA family hydrolase [Clostridiaceae bacterium]
MSNFDNLKFKAILFDSGRVLNGPTTGHWYITPNSFNFVNAKKYFLKYYNIFSKCLPQLQLNEDNIPAITKDYVYNYSKYSFFQDVINQIPQLSKSYKLAVISDAWPSLENVFKEAGLRDYFSSFVISSKIGVTKPHELMYKTALNQLNILPEEAIFIDDNIKNCTGAKNLGISSFVLCRDIKLYIYNRLFNRDYCIIRDLVDLKKLLL